MWIGLLLFFVLVFTLYLVRQNTCTGNKANLSYSPVCKGLPLLGSALEFGKNPLKFLQECRKQYGDVFTVLLPGRRMTFIFAPTQELRKIFFNGSPNLISFTAGVEPLTCRIFGISKKGFSMAHRSLLTTLRSELGAKHIPQLAHRLINRYLFTFRTVWGKEDEKEASNLLTETLSDASLRVIFGDEFANASPSLFKDFVDFDEWFELAATPLLPHFLLRPFVKSRRKLLDTISQNWKYTKNAPIHKLTEAYGNDGNVPSLLLSALWATWSNVSPTSFWTLTHILADEKAKVKVLAEVEKSCPLLLSSKTELSLEWIFSNLPFTAYCVSETLRLYASVVDIRKVVENLEFREFIIRKGDYLCISPAVSHRETTLFPQSEDFIPDRFQKQGTHPNAVFDKDLLTFGGGFYKCPGQSFAMVEIVLLIALVFYLYDIQLVDRVPKMKESQSVGIKKPSCSCRIHYLWKRRLAGMEEI
ncbi:24-hydroxycholesterol 7-alpha-hydroxylase [Galdieria sulphuraria]|uniref:Cytochrome P45, family 39, subfamily A (24-hydroxycholesterol7alpha-hydroxylase) n=1 Tax=Galdieria sulphuraria TaxID=130081 RepID=M2Y4F8_GALSU|nr:cytochrome P45, family 39, subfamily A (24-hydroxycholesterol7alpha-hydroxylase) [Galdieria sulphuraria]EME30724.1 cytochrome P45, family 39, subfamily A (24-hydroxycholesterol7alpha-hydroxylase) [Galdieria sulphuraria]GJD10796.1 24-hydroxycholesterol 7-alpha-hydroxylase [Galdieria sulphuraria]|eukprot:XP_005707244.1 cytochrome P45, family 39, subfamily A (24-hydroxycholesterol7alpha-hydroxylase) [Galdieria sulphuraria]